jgi:glycine oxidase
MTERANRSTPDVAVVGDGIIGLAIAYEAALRGARVALIGKSRPGAASAAAAGLISPGLAALAGSVRTAFIAARDAFQPFCDGVAHVGGEPVDVKWGLLELPHAIGDAERFRSLGSVEVDLLDGVQTRDLEPVLGPVRASLLHRREAGVAPPQSLSVLSPALSRFPDVTRISALVQEVILPGGPASPAHLRLEGGNELNAARVVLAAGAWTPAIAGVWSPPVRPIRGQILVIPVGGELSRAVMRGHHYLVPRGARVVVGSTTEDAGFDPRTTPEGLATLSSFVRETAPSLARELPAAASWAGLRPMTPDGLPVIGAREDERIIYACGHGRNGVFLAPFTALAVSDLLEKRAPAAEATPFDPSRFPGERP